MALTIVFLGRLADLADMAEQQLELAGPVGWSELHGRLDPALADALGDEKVQVALNGLLLADRLTLQAHDGDEVAFLPPVSGG